MENVIVSTQCLDAVPVRTTQTVIYPAIADSVDFPDISFWRSKAEDIFVLQASAQQQSFPSGNAIMDNRVRKPDDLRLKELLAPILSEWTGLSVVVRIVGPRSPVLKIVRTEMNVIVEAHWNLFVPYFDHIKSLPIVHPEILDIFTEAVFRYALLAMKLPARTEKNELRSRVIDAYAAQPELLLASLDIFNKPNIYHIRPTKVWLDRISAANDNRRLEIDISDAVTSTLVTPDLSDEVARFTHEIAKNYAFRYGDYLWTQRYKIIFGGRSSRGMVVCDGNYIVINIHPLVYHTDWKPVLYLGLGYAVMFAMLRSSGIRDRGKCIHLAMMKTWNRYLSFDESEEQRCVREFCGFSQSTAEQQCRSLSECMIGEDDRGHVDDFVMLVNHLLKETFEEKLKAMNDGDGTKTAAYFEQLSNTIRNLNTTLMRNNINHGKLIEALRNDDFDHLQLARFLRTGCLDDGCVVDVSEWLLLRTLLYDLINAPKVFKNDYKMLLRVLTKVNKSLIAYIWTLALEQDPRHEIVSTYIAKVMNDIFVFDRVKIYEIVADPEECLEAEAVTGYLLNWAVFTPQTRRSIVQEVLTGLPHNVVAQLGVRKAGDVDELIRVMGTRASGLIGFYLHQAYRWGSAGDELTERIRSYFPKLLAQAQRAMVPAERIRGGAMLLLLLAQIISDERDGFAGNIVITEEERQIVRDLIKQCVDWDQRHFVMMIAGMAAGYIGSIDGWVLQQFDRLLARYDGGDRVMLRSVVQFDVGILIDRALMTSGDGDERALLRKIQLLRFGVDPVISDEANRALRAAASRYGIESAEAELKKKDIRGLLQTLSRRMRSRATG